MPVAEAVPNKPLDPTAEAAAGQRQRQTPWTERGSVPRIVLARRSVLKAVTYRVLIMCLDFGTIYLFTGAIRVALGFMIASNVYTTVAYFAHERLWSHVKWGIAGSA